MIALALMLRADLPTPPPTPPQSRGGWSLRLVRRFRAEGSSWFAAFRWGWLLCFAASDARLRPLVAAFSRSWRGADVRPSPLSASSQTPPYVRSRRQTRSALQPLSAAPLPWLRSVLALFGGPCIARRRWAGALSLHSSHRLTVVVCGKGRSCSLRGGFNGRRGYSSSLLYGYRGDRRRVAGCRHVSCRAFFRQAGAPCVRRRLPPFFAPSCLRPTLAFVCPHPATRSLSLWSSSPWGYHRYAMPPLKPFSLAPAITAPCPRFHHRPSGNRRFGCALSLRLLAVRRRWLRTERLRSSRRHTGGAGRAGHCVSAGSSLPRAGRPPTAVDPRLFVSGVSALVNATLLPRADTPGTQVVSFQPTLRARLALQARINARLVSPCAQFLGLVWSVSSLPLIDDGRSV